MEETLNTVQRAAREVLREYGLKLHSDSGDAVVDTESGLYLVRFNGANGNGSLAIKTQDNLTLEGVAGELRKQLGTLGHTP